MTENNSSKAVCKSANGIRFVSVLAIGIAYVTTAFGAPAWAAIKTVFKDPSQKTKLMGKHMLSLQWLQYNDDLYGTATVTEKNGLLHLSGEQRSKRKDVGYLKVDGTITEVGKTSFKFNGEIKTSVKSINNGDECLRTGEMNFLIKGKRKYWRLQEMKSPCSEVTDYVDLYFN